MSSATHETSNNHAKALMNLDIRHIPLAFDNTDPDASALRLVQAYSPEWKDEVEGGVVFVRFTDGITNTLTKATKNRPGKTKSEIDQDAILLRAYGSGTDVLIDREREIKAHNALAERGLAPELLARFDNGLMYRFVEGDVCSPQDLRRPEIYRQVAKRLGQWHATVPIEAISISPAKINGTTDLDIGTTVVQPKPNTWTVMQQWLTALPTETSEEQSLKDQLAAELETLHKQFGHLPGLLDKAFVFGHCDLLSGNVIVEYATEGEERPVSFIDYEYATPSPAAFDISNHFAEWAGFDCDHTGCPTRSQRREFIEHYVSSFYQHSGRGDASKRELDTAIQQLYAQIDDMRGLPGLYWGIWSLIQAGISQIDFNYAEYAQIRLGEYWAWKHEADGSREKRGENMPLREQRWSQE